MSQNERPSPTSLEEKTVYGASVKKHDAGYLLYEMKGLRDGYGSAARLGMIVTRDGVVYLTMEENDPGQPDLSIQFNSTAKGTTTPYMAERLARIPRTLFEKEGKWLDDDPDFKVSSLQEKLIIAGQGSSSQGSVRGIKGDGGHGTTMSLFIAETGDVTIQLIQMPSGPLSFRTTEMIFPSHAPTFYSGTLNELREATREIIASRIPTAE